MGLNVAGPGVGSLHRTLGLTDEELAAIVGLLGREPNPTELAMFSVMWSEHCSYKSSRVHLRTLPTDGPRVLAGPGGEAGAVDLGGGVAAVFKIESHSHPSAVEPVQGAATGVGGIVRDVLSMGARPAALLDSLRFGPLDQARNRYLMAGVVAGIGGYGNCIGVPTVGGEVVFAPEHTANPTVDVLCLGFAPVDRLLRGGAGRPGSVLVLFGAATGRDGIGGVSVLASRTLEEDAPESRPSVQIGDPFTGKLLIEACMEMVEGGLVEGLKDLGGAGLTCAASESAAAAGLGAEVDLDAVARREPAMAPFEVLTSESQERMLAIVRPERVAAVVEVCAKWGLRAAAAGELVEGGRLTIRSGGEVVADVPARALTEDAPAYERPVAPDEARAHVIPRPAFEGSLREAFLAVLGSPDVCSKRWIFEQYDSLVQGQTLRGPGAADAAAVRVKGTRRAVAISTDGRGRWGRAEPYLGGAHAVAEAARNVACAGARPLAATNCLNFGNPERPEVMRSFVQTVRGIGDACRALGTPITGGNVSFYNESGGVGIAPTPVVGVLGLIEEHRRLVGMGFPSEGLAVYLLGETRPELCHTQFAEAVGGADSQAGPPPLLDLEAERRLQDLLVEAADRELLAACHDCSDGGLAIALAEMAIAGRAGFTVEWDGEGLEPFEWLFSESASRAVAAARPGREQALEAAATARSVLFRRLGTAGGDVLRFEGLLEISVAEAGETYEGALPRLMAAGGRG